jgi:hypothetical protein
MKSNIQDVLHSILNQVANLVKRMSDDDLRELMQGELVLDFVKRDGSRKRLSSNNKKPLLDKGEMETLVSQLRTKDDRESGLALLNECCPGKNSLERLARHIDIPVIPRDNINTLKEKIIEATIGYRLRSIAIQGKRDVKTSNLDSTEIKPS